MSNKIPNPPGVGAGKPAHPFAVTVEEPVAVSELGEVMVAGELPGRAVIADPFRTQSSQTDMVSSITHTTPCKRPLSKL